MAIFKTFVALLTDHPLSSGLPRSKRGFHEAGLDGLAGSSPSSHRKAMEKPWNW